MREYIVKKSEAGQRLDKYLFRYIPGAPKSFVYKMLRKKNIVLNGKKSEGSEKVEEGDCVRMFLADSTIDSFSGSETSAKEDFSAFESLPAPEVIYEDDDRIFMNKPAGVLSQKAADSDISMNEIMQGYLYRKGFFSGSQGIFTPAVVNRLDRNTSGLILGAKTPAGAIGLSKVLKDRSLKKEYLCIVTGTVKKNMSLRGSLKKDESANKSHISEDGDGAEIMTDVSVLAYGKDITLLKVHLITGKSHQIRAHLSYAGHPLIGDAKYGDAHINKYFKEKYGLKHQLLHAYTAEFEGGFLGGGPDKRTVTAPLPDIFEQIIRGEKIKWRPGQEEV